MVADALKKKKKKLLRVTQFYPKLQIYYENSSAACAEDLRLSSTWAHGHPDSGLVTSVSLSCCK